MLRNEADEGILVTIATWSVLHFSSAVGSGLSSVSSVFQLSNSSSPTEGMKDWKALVFYYDYSRLGDHHEINHY